MAINYLSSEDKAKEVAVKVEKHSVKAILIQGVRASPDSECEDAGE